MYESVHFQNWELIIDKQATLDAYADIQYGGSQSCSCDDCKEYFKLIDSIFPDNIKQLFSQIGIDYRKDAEVVHILLDKVGIMVTIAMYRLCLQNRKNKISSS